MTRSERIGDKMCLLECRIGDIQERIENEGESLGKAKLAELQNQLGKFWSKLSSLERMYDQACSCE
jgi:hypothetical protein